LQIEKARKLDITEEVYFDIIRQKTATLIAACTAAGARSVGADNEMVKRFHRFGELLGMAFQMKDDLFDYTDAKIGKPTGIDIKEQKMTLPLIHALNNCDKKERKWLINSVKKHNTDKKRVKEVIAFVNKSGGIQYTIEKMKAFQVEALKLLEGIDDSPAKQSLITLVNYVIDRKL